MQTKIGTAMLEIMQEHDIVRVMWGDAWALDSAFKKANARVKVSHPLNKWEVVLNALDRDNRFEKTFVGIDVWINNCWHKRAVRCFAPIQKSP